MTIHSIKSSFTSGMAFNHSLNNHQIITDTTAADGGNDSGPSPKRMMLASLAGCTGIDVVSILNKMKVPFSHFSIEIEASLTEEHPKIYHIVQVTFTIKLPEADRPKMEKAVKLSEEKYCGVMAMFKAFAQVTLKIVYLP